MPHAGMNAIDGPHANLRVQAHGEALEDAKAVMILLHGRGSTAQDILGVTRLLESPGFSYLAPQAAGNTWYPYSFLEPIERNEPALSSALHAVDKLVTQVVNAGIHTERIVLGGFSQGACLASEYVARNPQRYGGLLIFSGGVIGPLGAQRSETGDLDATPVFIGCSDVDAHIPLARVKETGELFTRLGGEVNVQVYPGMGHTINQDEIDQARAIVERVLD